ncbi:LLM class flavin-dependent oxidoreductase [Chryseobacterium gossypii]|uniref:LLM class flavin-dependent oxidoreductase n=1 Tax=Chryseobacterium gossypii TaxID=3231602 RepID=UPI0035261D27
MHYSIFSVQDHYPTLQRSLPEFYHQLMEQGVLADQLGYDAFFVAEHHFHEYGVIPNPAVFLSALSQRTKNIKLGPAISILPFHHPLNIAENYTMLDIISSGRLILGVGSGYLKHEFEGYDISLEEKRARFDENLAILDRALKGEACDSNKFHSIRNVKINILPVQREVPLYIAALRKEAAYFIGKQGYNMICIPYASVDHFSEIQSITNQHKQGASDGDKKPLSAIFAFHTHIADTDDQAKENAEEAFNLYVKTRLYAKQQTYDDIIKTGLSLFGSPETVSDKIVELHQMGIDHLMLLHNFGMLCPELVQSSMKKFMTEVKPLVDQKIY